MAITEAYSGTETVGATEWSMTTDTSGPDATAAAGCFQAFVELNALAAGDVFEFRAYEKTLSSSTQRRFMTAVFAGVQGEAVWVSPSFMLINGWDFTLIKISGTDRAINWSIRKA